MLEDRTSNTKQSQGFIMLICTVQIWCKVVQAIPCRMFALGIFRLTVYWCNYLNTKMKRGCPQPRASPRSSILITSKAFWTHETVERCHSFDHKLQRQVNRLGREILYSKSFKSNHEFIDQTLSILKFNC